jgi:hypothetical protein
MQRRRDAEAQGCRDAEMNGSDENYDAVPVGFGDGGQRVYTEWSRFMGEKAWRSS